jgi:hypothetical protein
VIALASIANLIVMTLVASSAMPVRAADDLVTVGQHIYRQGILPSGQPLRGMVRPGVSRVGAEAACVACHRRSGFGMTEGTSAIRPITAAALFQVSSQTSVEPRVAHQLGHPVRPAYNDEKLARAIRDGEDVTGRPLVGMPRYALRNGEMAPLLAYLKTLDSDPEPAVTASDIHLATIIQPGVASEKRDAMLEVLTAFVRDKNAATRSDERRRVSGSMRMQRAYRKWQFHVWELTGAASTWGAQLDEYYRRQPVFAVISGIGNSDWGPIQDFSERQRVPCVFPQTVLPGGNDERFYTRYLSRGVLLEADVLARHLADHPSSGRLVQIYRRGTVGAIAATAFRTAFRGNALRIEEYALGESPADEVVRKLIGDPANAIVMWLDAPDLAGVSPPLTSGVTRPSVYLSPTLLGGFEGAKPLAVAGADTFLVYPWASPAARDAAQLRTRTWLQRKGIVVTDDPVQANTLFAATIVGEVLSHILDSFSREYFVERLEHAVQQSLIPSGFPNVSLGPDQSFAAKGSYVVRLSPNLDFKAVSDWIVP